METDTPVPANQGNSMVEKSRRFLFGDDIFISYSRVNSTYALALANELTKRKLSCFLDQYGTPPGAELPKELIDTIKRCSTMVLIGSKHAVESSHVGKEVREFLETGRPIIPITFVDEKLIDNQPANFNSQDLTGTLEAAEWYPQIAGIAKTTEISGALKSRTPSDNVILRIVSAVEFRSRSKRLRKTFFATLGLILILAVLGVILIVKANDKVDSANAEAKNAADLANRKTQEAANAANLANIATLRANSEANRAEEQKIKADEESEKARKAKDEADKQTAIAIEKTQIANNKTKQAELAEQRKIKAEKEAKNRN